MHFSVILRFVMALVLICCSAILVRFLYTFEVQCC